MNCSSTVAARASAPISLTQLRTRSGGRRNTARVVTTRARTAMGRGKISAKHAVSMELVARLSTEYLLWESVFAHQTRLRLMVYATSSVL